MPLPDQSILQDGDKLAAQRDPGFQTENLPSPAGFKGPQIAPIPIPGTGMTQGGSQNDGQKAYLDQFKLDILNADQKVTPGKLPTFTASEVYNPRYNSILPGEDSEEAFALGQSWTDKWANSIIKMAATAGGTFINTMTSIPDTISSIGNGTPYNTVIGNSIDKFLKNIENQFPNYYTRWEQEHPFQSAIPGSGGFANFWGDKVIKNLGFTIGALGGAVVQDAALAYVGGGIAAIPGVANQVGKAALWLNKIFAVGDDVGDLTRVAAAAGRSGDDLVNLTAMARRAKALKVGNGTRYALSLYGSAASEAGFEARDGYNTVKQDLIEAYQKENGYSPVGKELAEIEKYAEASANVRFGANLALLSVSNAIQFDTILKPFSAAKAGYRSTIQKEIAEGMAIKQKGPLGAFEAVVPSTISGKVWNKVRPLGPAIITEGVFEEGGQFAAQIGSENYYERKYLYDKGLSSKQYAKDETPWDAKDQIANILHSTVEGIGAQFNTDEGLENMVLGAITGAIFGGFTRYMGRNTNATQRQTVLSMLNSRGVTDFLENNFDTAAKAHRISEDMKQAVKDNDIFKYKNFQHEQFVEFINSGIKSGRFDVRMEQLSMLKGMENEDFQKAFGLDQGADNVATVNEYVGMLETKAKAIKRTYDLINTTFTNPYTFNPKATTDAQKEENEKSIQFENWKSDLVFLASINMDTEQRLRSIESAILGISPNVSNMILRDLTDRNALKARAKAMRDEQKNLQDGIDKKLTPTTPDDAKRIKSLDRRATAIERSLNNPNITPKEYEDLFTDLLTYTLNSDTDETNITVPKEGITQLIEYAKDINRLYRYRESAAEAFDRLSSEEGFNKHFRDAERGKAKADAKAQAAPPSAQTTPGQTPAPPAPVVVPTITITAPDGATQTFEKEKEVYVNTGTENPEKVVVVGQTEDGITVEKADGTQEVIKPETFFKEDELTKQINQEDIGDVSSVPPPTQADRSVPPGARGTAKKDLAFATQATTDPPYDERTTPDSNFQRRHQNFLFNLGQEDFNVADRHKLRIVPVTAKTAEQFGFSSEWMKGLPTDIDDGAIRAVYVIDDRDGNGDIYFAGEKGQRLGKIGQTINPNEAIYSNLSTTSFMFGNEPRYTNKENLDEEQVKTWWRKERARLLRIDNLNDTPLFQFDVSRGIPNFFENDVKNSVLEVGLMEAKDLDLPVITIATQGNVAIMGAFNEEGEGISAFKSGVNMPLGTPLLNFGGNLIFLNNRKFSTTEARNIVELISFLADRTKPRESKSAIFKYLNKIIHMANPSKKIEPGANSITIDGPNLYLGTSKTPILMTPQSIQDNSTQIFDFLTNTFHNVNNTELGRIKANPKANDLNFNELKIENGEVVPGTIWKNYNHYLLSNVNPEGKQRGTPPLSTNIIVPQADEVPIIAKYSILKGTDFDSNMYVRKGRTPIPGAPTVAVPKTQAAPPASAKPATPKQEEQGIKVAGDHQVITVTMGEAVMNFAFNITARDTAGNITDIEPVGNVKEDGSITPFKKPDVIKNIILNSLTDSQVKKDATNAPPPAPQPEVVPAPQPTVEQQVKSADYDYVEVDMAGKKHKLAFTILTKDANGNITEITPVGNIQEDGSIVSFKKPDVIKGIILDNLKASAAPEIVEVPSPPAKVEIAGPADSYEKFFEAISPFIGIADSAFDWNIDIPELSKAEQIKGVDDIRSGKKYRGQPTAAARKLKEALQKIFDSKTIPMLRGRGSASLERMDMPFSDYFGPSSQVDDEGLGGSFSPLDDTQFRAYTPGNYKVADLAKEFKEFQEIVPDFITIRKVSQMLKTTSGGLAWGAIHDASVYIYQNAEVGTTYHEAFEAIWGHFLTGREQQELYNELRKRNGSFLTYMGETKLFRDASLKEAKEQIAEEFRDYKMSGKLPQRTAQRSFFQRLMDFIRKIIFGDSSEINQIFKKINKGYYRNFSTSLRNINDPQYREVGVQNFSETLINDTIQGMTSEMFSEIFKENSSIITQLEDGVEFAASDIYNKLLSRLSHYFEDKTAPSGTLNAEFGPKYQKLTTDEDRTAMLNQVKSIRANWSDIKGNWDAFVKEHKRYLKVFNAEFTINDDGDIDFADDNGDIDENKSQSEYDRDIMQIDAKNNASSKVKLLFATLAESYWVEQATTASIGATRNNQIGIKRDNSLLALPKLASYAKLFNYILHNTSNINGFYDIWDKMKSLVSKGNRKNIDANVQRLINRIDFDKGFEGKTVDQTKLILSLENTLSKQKPAFFRQFTDFQRNTYFRTTITNSKIDQLIDNWVANIKGSEFVKAVNNKFVFDKALIGISDNIQFLNKLGIPITKAELSRLSGGNVTKFNAEVNAVKSLIENAAAKGTPIPVISSKQLDFEGRLKGMAQLYANYVVGDDTQSQHPNLDNEPTSNFVLNNFVSTMLSDANNASNRDEFLGGIDNGYLNDIFHQDSILLNSVLFNADGTKAKTVDIGIVEGRETWDQDNKSAATLTEAERQVYEINNNLNGVFYTLLPADAKSEWAIHVGTYLSAANFFGTDSERGNEVTKFSNQMYKWLQTEIDLAKDYPNRKSIVALNRKMGTRSVGNSLRFFADILPADIVRDIHEKVIDGDATLPDILPQQEMRSLMRNYAMDKVARTRQNLLDWRVIDQTGDEFRLNGFDRAFLDTHISKSQYLSQVETDRLLAFREMNYIMNQIEMHKFFFGDPAQYKDELKRIKSFLSGREVLHVDSIETSEGYNQWANTNLNKVGDISLAPTDPGYQSFKNHANSFTVRDIDFESQALQDIVDTIGEDRAKPYTEGNEADAQAHITAAAYRELVHRSGGRYTAKQEKQYQWEMAWERNDKFKDGIYKYSSPALQAADNALLKNQPDTDVAFPILKLVHSGTTTVNGRAVVSLHKASWAPLFYRWYKGRALGDLYNAMQAKGTDYVVMESGNKVGIQSESVTRLYNDKGKINIEGISQLRDQAIPFKQFGIQVEQAKKDKGQTEGSQARKIVTGDLMSNGVPIDFIANYSTETDAYDAWNQLEFSEKLEQSPIFSKIKRHDGILEDLTNARTENVMRRLGMDTRADGTVYFTDKKLVSDFILAEIERRELPRNIAQGLEINPLTGDFTQVLEANAQYSKIRAILYSIIEKTIMRPKVNGGQKTMLSTTGMEKSARVIKREVNGKPVYTSNELKFYSKGKDGTEACEVMLPYWFGKSLMEAGSKRTKEEVIKYLNSTTDGQKLLRGIGFRIPTQGLNSIDFFVVKDFLPEQMGDVVVLPSEITVKAGSDFDIDKLNTYMYNYYIDNTTGYPTIIKYMGSEEATKEYLSSVVEKTLSAGQKRALTREILENTPEGEETNSYAVELLTEDFLGDRKADIITSLYEKALQNEYFDSIAALVSLKENFERLITPNDASELKGYRNDMLKLKGQAGNELGNYGKLLDSTFMVKERQAYMSSKQVVGVSAVSQTSHAVAQNLEGGMTVTDPTIVARFPHNTVGGQISLSGLYTAGSKGFISNINSQTTDGGVDVAKDKFLAEMGINQDTLGTFLTLVRMGAKPWWAITFLNQPIIQDYLKMKAINSSVSQINPNVFKMSDYQIRQTVYAKYGGIGTKKEKLRNKPIVYTIKKMEEMIAAKSLTAQDNLLQVQILDDYNSYNSLGWDLFHFYQGSNWDTARLNDPNTIRIKNVKFAKGNNLKVTPVSRVMKDTFIGSMRENALLLDRGLRSLINVQSGEASVILDSITAGLMKQRGLNEETRRQLLMEAELSMLDYAIQTNGMLKGSTINAFIAPLILGGRSTARYIDAIKKSDDKRLKDNPFITNLQVNMDTRDGFPSTITMMERDFETYTSNVWTDAFRELRDDNTVISIDKNPANDRTVAQIYNNLIITGMLQTGSKRTNKSFNHLIPNETYSKFTQDALRNLRLEDFLGNNAFYRANWTNDKLVPRAELEYSSEAMYEINPQGYYPFIQGSIPDNLKAILGTDKVPSLLNVNAWKNKDRKMIKIVNDVRDPETKQIISRSVRLFQRIDVYAVDQSEPAPLSLDPKGKRIIFKEVNAWGNDTVREFYSSAEPSILPYNTKVAEATDEQIIYAIYKAGVKNNIYPEDLQAMIEAVEGTMPDEDVSGNDAPFEDPYTEYGYVPVAGEAVAPPNPDPDPDPAPQKAPKKATKKKKGPNIDPNQLPLFQANFEAFKNQLVRKDCK